MELPYTVVWIQADYAEAPIKLEWWAVGREMCEGCSQNLPVWMDQGSGTGLCSVCLLSGEWNTLTHREPLFVDPHTIKKLLEARPRWDHGIVRVCNTPQAVIRGYTIHFWTEHQKPFPSFGLATVLDGNLIQAATLDGIYDAIMAADTREDPDLGWT
jgi:hypothetical protein